ncbi:MAG TPA: YCF48-related protein [Terriglobales bacterium]|nr:YCF48-related protein [Terriglobales bacterium]
MSKSKLGIYVCVFVAILCSSPVALTYSELGIVHLKMVDFFSLDSQQAWVLVQNNKDKTFLFRTNDGGNNWEALPTPFSLQNIFFVDPDNGWATAMEPNGEKFRFICLRTSDSGQSWSKLAYVGSSKEPSGIAFDTIDHGWIVGEGESGRAFVYETNDSGEHWNKLPWKSKPASGLYGVRLHGGIVYAWSSGAGGSGIFQLRPGMFPEQISALETMNFAFVSGDSIVSAGQLDVYLKDPTDGDWDEVLHARDMTFWDMKFADEEHGCVVGGEVYCTADGGRTWEPRRLPRSAKGENEFFYRLYLLDSLHGWADGDDSIYETNDGAHTWSKVDFFDKDGKPLTHTRRIN